MGVGMRQCVVLVLLVGMVSGGVLNWLGMLDTNIDTKHHEKKVVEHHKKDEAPAKQNKEGFKKHEDKKTDKDIAGKENYKMGHDTFVDFEDDEEDINNKVKEERENKNEE